MVLPEEERHATRRHGPEDGRLSQERNDERIGHFLGQFGLIPTALLLVTCLLYRNRPGRGGDLSIAIASFCQGSLPRYDHCDGSSDTEF